ncbi:Rhomboid-like protein [Candidatus Koribacter versatilis Ellin345]|uniref:Rhomboid-like protein n=1 Tax=Koribacter versatilis (strain Ellin345) TaxID=204669 RepID=Q1IQ33_KORVE|nr:rhomboid family intramembrane serine protease [Candidatus Koribacter versatilis]ABF41017.1 Rhomboid-like protein [Candidatus Koribacter versatilis Ellin345]
MLLPIGREKKIVKRLPIVTVILILTNILAFCLTIRDIDDDTGNRNLNTVRNHLLVMKARFPDVVLDTEAQQMVDDFRKTRPEAWQMVADPNREPMDTWEAVLVDEENPKIEKLQEQVNLLCIEFRDLQNRDNSVLWMYAFHSYHPKYRSYISHQFLHGGFFHLLGNMWMLWLCGVVLEEVWGPYVVLGFYLCAGVFAAAAHGAMNPNSLIPMLGASGSVAGLMGGMLVRYPKLKVKMLFWLFFYWRTFFAPVYILAPLWFVAELFWGGLGERGIAHWAHVGGFAFGAVVALAFDFGRVEKITNPEEPVPVVWKPDTEFLHAAQLLEKRETNTALAILRNYVKKNSNVIDAWELLQQAQIQKNDANEQRQETLPVLIRLYLGVGNDERALLHLREFRRLGGTILPASTWLELARSYERVEQWEIAAREFENLGISYYATDRTSLTALLSAARIYLTKLDRPADANRLYQAAGNSPIPHLEMDAVIKHGISQSAAANTAKSNGVAF